MIADCCVLAPIFGAIVRQQSEVCSFPMSIHTIFRPISEPFLTLNPLM